MKTKTLFEIPERNMKYITVPVNQNYIFFQNGDMFNRASGMYLKRIKSTNGYTQNYVLINATTKRCCSFSIRKNIVKYFNQTTIPEIEGTIHKPMLEYEDMYEIYSNGAVWNKKHLRWLKQSKNKEGYLMYCIRDINNKVKKGKGSKTGGKTEYVHRLLAQNFIVNGSLEGYEVHHKSRDITDNRLENIEVMKEEDHRRYHYDNYQHHEEYLEKLEQRRKLKQEQLLKEKEERKQQRIALREEKKRKDKELKEAMKKMKQEQKEKKLQEWNDKKRAKKLAREYKEAEKEMRRKYAEQNGKRMYKHSEEWLRKKEKELEEKAKEFEELRKKHYNNL